MSVRIRNAAVVATMDSRSSEITGCDILIENGRIAGVGRGLPKAEEEIDADDCVVTPGLVNTHHHLFQNLTRAVPRSQNALLFDWLRVNYQIWRELKPEDILVSARLGLAELALSGCTLSSDHLYLYPNGIRLEDTIEAAADIGIRFHATRGSMSIGESAGGLPPDFLVEKEDNILDDCIRVVDAFHDPGPGAMVRIGIAPCSPFSVSRELMRDSALLARDKKVMLHTHLAENDEDIEYGMAKFGCRPGQFIEGLGWTGADVWHAHCVKLDKCEIRLFAETRTGIAHCPNSNCRLGSGIAPLRRMLDCDVPVGLGVDGSASNDSGNLLAEARQAMLLQRVKRGADAMSAREALQIATIGGAKVLGRDDVGSIEIGKFADIAIWDLGGIEFAGHWDEIASLVFCGSRRVRDLLVGGQRIVSEGRLVSFEEEELVGAHWNCVRRLVGK
ncbi:MAG: 8-oxoguanine deaminase [Albidovulum sp.]|nr:8-oxoguanine deaminase [Albidovulum sp.]MDE0533525.1 8-oxoguanine deaminase [Albidovulum sp.]